MKEKALRYTANLQRLISNSIEHDSNRKSIHF